MLELRLYEKSITVHVWKHISNRSKTNYDDNGGLALRYGLILEEILLCAHCAIA